MLSLVHVPSRSAQKHLYRYFYLKEVIVVVPVIYLRVTWFQP